MKRSTNLWGAVQGAVVTENATRQENAAREIATIEEGTRNLLEQKPAARKVPKAVYGFTTTVEERVDRTTDIREKRKLQESKRENLGKCKQFTQSQVDFAAQLASRGLQPIAVVPSVLWNALCKKFGLYRFEHIDEGGKTTIERVNPDILGMAFTFVFVGSIIAILSTIGLLCGGSVFAIPLIAAAIISAFGTSYAYDEDKPLIGTLLLILTLGFMAATILTIPHLLSGGMIGFFFAMVLFALAGLIASLFMGCVCFGATGPGLGEKALKSLLKALNEIAVRYAPQRFLLKMLWPDGTDSIKESDDGERGEITVRFPKAPQDFIQILMRVKEIGFQPMIAAVPEAILVDRKEIGMIRESEIEKLTLDPILYQRDEKGENIAVLSSFGEFPNEEKVLEWVRKEGLKLCFN